jgi:hypothetical protein
MMEPVQLYVRASRRFEAAEPLGTWSTLALAYHSDHPDYHHHTIFLVGASGDCSNLAWSPPLLVAR